MVDNRGELILGNISADTEPKQRLEITMQLEEIGFLELAEPYAEGGAVVGLIEQILISSERYQMASALHLEAVHADYERLQKQHKALQASELRYKELSESLEQKVADQVKEIEKSHQQLMQSEKLAAVGQLAGGVAHEINNPLSFILNNLGTASEYVGDIGSFMSVAMNSPSAEAIKSLWKEKDLDFVMQDFETLLLESADGAKRVATIVSNLRDFSSVDDNQPMQLCDLNNEIQSAIEGIKEELGANIVIAPKLTELPPLLCHPLHMRQIIINMVKNSAAAIGSERGVIYLATAKKGEEILIAIKDNGVGMSAELQSRIFEPFYTTQEVGNGTGLGLTVVYDVISQLGGQIEVKSEEGKGTTLTIHLPVKT